MTPQQYWTTWIPVLAIGGLILLAPIYVLLYLILRKVS